MRDCIALAHGSGGRAMHELIENIFKRHFSNEILGSGDDAARLDMPAGRLAFTTDSYVVSPIFFRGGSIGKLAVCGTVNDLSALGAVPLYLSCGFILEEGLPLAQLEEIVRTMAATAAECGVKVVTGDTKVVQKGAADGIFINTSGIGLIPEGIEISGSYALPGDRVIITGPIGEHGCAVMLDRERLGINSALASDCAPLSGMVQGLLDRIGQVHVLRDPTRGGLATTLNEISAQSGTAIKLYEEKIPVKDEVRGICELLGLDPLYMANEGRMVVIVAEAAADEAVSALRGHRYGRDACIIGEVLDGPAGRVFMQTITGGGRILDMLSGEQLPRIC
jgi:hydrogenase expression/formation protein HypE